MGEVDLKEY
jgi:hypothetical protein